LKARRNGSGRVGISLPAILLLIRFLAVNSSAQDSARRKPSDSAFSPELVHDLITLRDAALADDYAFRQVAYLTENIGPRPSGSVQAEHAAEYVADEMRKLGLEVRLEEVKVPHWVRGAETAELSEFPGQVPKTSQKIVVTALGGSTATPNDGLTAEVLAVRNFDELTALGRSRVAGKIVLFNFPFDSKKAAAGYALDAYAEAVVYRVAGARAAAELGAVASLVRSVGGADYRLAHTGFSTPAGIPAGAVAAEDADLISDLAAQGKVRMRLVLTPQSLPDTTGYNVVADVRGSEHPEQVVVVSGHLDSWDLGTGAIDDGAGVGIAMETAHLLQTLHLRPKRTIRVIAWMDEESGGRGRQAYTAAHSAEFANHVAAIESDLGAAHPLGFDVKMSAQAMEGLKPVQKILESFGANLIKLVPFSPGSDISGMSQAGVPSLGIMQDGRAYFNYHHTAADTLDKIVPAELRENAAAMAVMGYALACAPQPLPR
jgi:Zn-dependent M28 family amino/carboxypeptidase